MNNKGYFVSTVSDSVYFKRRKRAKVYYTIKASAPYTVNNVEYSIPDALVQYYVFASIDLHSLNYEAKGGNEKPIKFCD